MSGCLAATCSEIGFESGRETASPNKGKRHGIKSRPKEGGRPRGQELEKLQEQLKQRLLGLASDADPRAI